MQGHCSDDCPQEAKWSLPRRSAASARGAKQSAAAVQVPHGTVVGAKTELMEATTELSLLHRSYVLDEELSTEPEAAMIPPLGAIHKLSIMDMTPDDIIRFV